MARLMAAPRHTWWKTVREDEYRRPDIARRLLSLAMDARLRDRLLAVDLSKAATTVVDLCDSPGVEELRFEAWKFASTVLREAGRYAELPTAFLRELRKRHRQHPIRTLRTRLFCLLARFIIQSRISGDRKKRRLYWIAQNAYFYAATSRECMVSAPPVRCSSSARETWLLQVQRSLRW